MLGEVRPAPSCPSCDICSYADIHGSWPPDHRGTHCADTAEATGMNPGCHRSWSGRSEAHCTVCHQHFTSDRVAELHVSYCTRDRTGTAERLRLAARRDGSPIFATTTRKDGEAWIRHDPRMHPFADETDDAA